MNGMNGAGVTVTVSQPRNRNRNTGNLLRSFSDCESAGSHLCSKQNRNRTPALPRWLNYWSDLPGELIDKITILEIKSQRMTDPAKLHNVRTELSLLTTRGRHRLRGNRYQREWPHCAT